MKARLRIAVPGPARRVVREIGRIAAPPPPPVLEIPEGVSDETFGQCVRICRQEFARPTATAIASIVSPVAMGSSLYYLSAQPKRRSFHHQQNHAPWPPRKGFCYVSAVDLGQPGIEPFWKRMSKRYGAEMRRKLGERTVESLASVLEETTARVILNSYLVDMRFPPDPEFTLIIPTQREACRNALSATLFVACGMVLTGSPLDPRPIIRSFLLRTPPMAYDNEERILFLTAPGP